MKRYSPYDHMVEHEDGEYIELAEYEALKAKHAKLVEALETIREQGNYWASNAVGEFAKRALTESEGE